MPLITDERNALPSDICQMISKNELSKDARLPGSDEGIIFARAVHDPQYLTRWISRLTKDWDRANVKISCFEDFPSGGKSKHVMITFDADTFDLLETT